MALTSDSRRYMQQHMDTIHDNVDALNTLLKSDDPDLNDLLDVANVISVTGSALVRLIYKAKGE